MQLTLLVFLGAGIGGATRHLVNLGAAKALGIDFPGAPSWSTSRGR